MFSHKYFIHIAISATLALALLFSGCDNSTDSEEDNTPPPIASFDSGDIAPDGTYSYTFGDEGTVDYYCKIHDPDMQGEITVTSEVDAVEQDTVIIENREFQPSELSVAPNTEVVWINRDNVDHTVTSGNPSSGGGGDY